MIAPPAISVAGTATYEGANLFGPLSLEIGAGIWTCLLGASGVGKSTLLRLIAGLEIHAEFSGSVTASDGAPLADRVAYMAQSDLLLPWTDVIGNVTLGARLRNTRPDLDRAHDLIQRVGLTDHISKRPGALSGGQRQRVALARTLMEDRPVILLDEPFSALDAKTRAEMQDLAAGLLKGRTVLLVTHDPGESARLGHTIQVMTHSGLTEVPVPKDPAPRPVDDPATLRAQGQLYAMLREAV